MNFTRILRIGLCAAILAACSPDSAPTTGGESSTDTLIGASDGVVEEARLITLGGGITEIVVALGLGELIVAVDTSSQYPEEVLGELPRLGYHRSISTEGVLALRPTQLIGSVDDGPELALQQLRDVGIAYHQAGSVGSVEEAYDRIRGIAMVLGRAERGEELVAAIAQKLAAVQASLPPRDERPRALLVYARGPGVLFVGGTGTIAEAVVVAAGGTHVPTNLEGFKPLTPESLIGAAPDVIIASDAGVAAIGGLEAFLAIPGVAQTPAGQNRAVVSLDEATLLSFGPRLGHGVEILAAELANHRNSVAEEVAVGQ